MLNKHSNYWYLWPMKLPKLYKGNLIKRYKRFFADISYKGETITAHTPNTGSMKGLLHEGTDCLFSTNNDPKRKLKHTLYAIKDPETKTWVGVHTGLPNKLVFELWENQGHKPWKKYKYAKPEVKISKETRFDLCLWSCLLYTSPSPRDATLSRMPSSA